MGLLARKIEEIGIPTVAVSILRDVTAKLGVPRAVFVGWPFGHPLGEPGHTAQQLRVIRDFLALLAEAEAPGTIRDPGYRWRREKYE